MTKPFSVLSKSIFTILFACSAIPAFAQHGGGGHSGGGGFHGGGGGGGSHSGGGGMRSSGGGGGARGGSYAAPAAGNGAPRVSAPSSMRSGNGFAPRPTNNSPRPGGNSSGGSQRIGNSASAPSVAADGQWHSFARPAGGGESGAAWSNTRPSENPANGWHAFTANRVGSSTGGTRSFSGQGNEVWENAPGARNVVPASRALSNIRGSARSIVGGNAGVRGNTPLSASSRIAGGSTFSGNRSFSGSLGTAKQAQLRGTFRFGYPFGNRGRCWNCGFGFGFGRWGGWGGWGWGLPWLGFWGWGPSWFDPWWGIGPAYGYGYYGYPNNYYIYNSPDSGNFNQYDDNSNPPAQQDDQDYDQGNTNGNGVTPNGPSPSSTPNSASLTVPVLIYMKNGAVYSVRDYWIVDGDLNYILIDGAQHSVDLNLVDLPRTNTENTKSGVKFIFKSEPDQVPPSPNELSPAPAPTKEITPTPQPEAHT